MRDNLTPQILFLVRFFKVKKFKHIGIAQSRKSAVPNKQVLMLFVRDHRPLIQHTADLTIQFTFCVTVCNAQAKVKLTRFIGFTASHNQQIACPWNFSHQR